jgi:uncharacterized membrane protein YkvA (DUF1232 family)
VRIVIETIAWKRNNQPVSKNSSNPTNDLGFFRELWQQARLTFSLMMDRQVPIYLKVLPLAAIAYLLMPLDFLPDVVPGLGQLDDLGVLLLGAKVFIEMAPQDVVRRYLQQYAGGAKVNGPTVLDAQPPQEQVYDAADADVIEGVIIDEDDLP